MLLLATIRSIMIICMLTDKKNKDNMKKILLLGSGELGKEFVIAAKRAGAYVVACDRYNDAPAMQVADEREVFSMLDGDV